MHVPIFLHVCFVCFHLRNGAVVTKEEVRWNKRYKEYETILCNMSLIMWSRGIM